MLKKKMFINGTWMDGEQYAPLLSPYSGEVLAQIPVATIKEAEKAIEAASNARQIMAKLPAHRRSAILEHVSDQLLTRKEDAARIIALEAAKPVTLARAEVARTVETYKFAAEEAKRIGGEVISLDASANGENRIAYTVREPIGVIGAITPFNFPMNLVAHKIAPAIASGNAVVLKPAGQTPLSALFIAELFEKAGLPAGGLNVITGSGSLIGEKMVTDERIRKITFTGSAAVGIGIIKKAGLKRVTLELGSNSAVIIDKEVSDPVKIIRRCVQGSFSYQGQVCISVQRIYVHQDIYQSFLEGFIAETIKLKAGDPLEEDTDVSVLISPIETERILNWIDEARSQGAKVACGGQTSGGIMFPTVITDAGPGLRISCQEVFGPVVVINRVESMEEAVARVNESNYGLQAGIYTGNIHTALDAVGKLQVGGVMVNDIPTFRVDHMPYGGVKDSGIGREGIKYAIEEMTEIKLVVFNQNK
jgi:acyl-CoA reductase-like NAD-dependent aldehyde dehydrogenase